MDIGAFSSLLVAVLCCHLVATSGESAEEYITELNVVAGSSDVKCPEGYQKLDTNLNSGVPNSDYVYACVQKGGKFRTPLNDVIVLVSDRKLSSADCPKKYTFVATNLNEGAGSQAKFVQLCYSRGLDTTIKTLDFITSASAIADLASAYPTGRCRTEDLNAGAGGAYVYLCFISNGTVNGTRVELTNVTYDFSRAVTGFTNVVTVADVLIYNSVQFESGPSIITGAHVYETYAEWGAAANESEPVIDGLPLMVVAGVPKYGAYGWSVSTVQMYETRVGKGIKLTRTDTYSITCMTPANTNVECGATYRQGTILVPFNATQTLWYDDGSCIVSNVTDYVYHGISNAVLEIDQYKIFEQP